jgi:hypothetical protein
MPIENKDDQEHGKEGNDQECGKEGNDHQISKEGKFRSEDNNVDVFQPEYDIDDEGSGLEYDAMDDQLLRDLGVDCVTPGTGHGGPTSANGCTIHVWNLA